MGYTGLDTVRWSGSRVTESPGRAVGTVLGGTPGRGLVTSELSLLTLVRVRVGPKAPTKFWEIQAMRQEVPSSAEPLPSRGFC